MNGDNLCNTLSSHTQGVVSLTETIEQTQLWINLAETFVVDDEQCIDMLCHLFNAIQRLIYLLSSLETERNGNDTHGENTQFLADTCDDRCCTSTRTTTHTSGDKCHLRTIVEHLLDILAGLFCSLTCTFRTVSST